MKISPLEIRQKTFEKNFRGYDKEEVDAFLLSLSQEWERVMDEIKDVKHRLQHSEKEVQKLREVESTLFKTLKTAEDTGANIVGQANKSAELLTKEARINSESILNEARTRSKIMLEEAEERSKNVLFEAQKRLNEILLEIQSLESSRQNLAHSLRQIGQDAIERGNRIANNSPLPDYGKLLIKEEPIAVLPKQLPTEPPVAFSKEEEPTKDASPILEEKKGEAETSTPAIQPVSEESSGSFFDQLG